MGSGPPIRTPPAFSMEVNPWSAYGFPNGPNTFPFNSTGFISLEQSFDE